MTVVSTVCVMGFGFLGGWVGRVVTVSVFLPSPDLQVLDRVNLTDYDD